MEPLNTPFIQARIEQAHKEFIDSVGEMPIKITADHQLFVKRMATRIEAVLRCFQKANIVDVMNQGSENGYTLDRSCFVFKLMKKGFDKAVFVWTDGESISINTARYPYHSGLDTGDEEVIRNIDFDSYNWVEFSDKLLHYIHQTIYARRQSIETKIFARVNHE